MARLIPGRNRRISTPVGGATASPAHDEAARAGVVRYDATLRELVRAAPAAAAAEDTEAG